MPKLHNKYHGTADETAVYIGRPGKWGNPYSHMPNTLAQFKCETRDEAVDKFTEWAWAPEQAEWRISVKAELAEKDLVCFCQPKRCHGSALMEIANYET